VRRTPLSTSRAAVLEQLRDQPEPSTLAALATVTGLHENTVREHLAGLVRMGLVRRFPAADGRRGRPAYLYESVEDAEAGDAEYAQLAVALATGLARLSPDPAADAVALGREWGRELSRERSPQAPDGASDGAPNRDGRSAVVALLDDLGFEPRPGEDPAEVLLTRCPLLQAAHREPEVVCGIHLGIVRGVLDEHGSDPAGCALEPFAGPGYCRLQITAA
jgi:predicted ArsR family transcriptional regulator